MDISFLNYEIKLFQNRSEIKDNLYKVIRTATNIFVTSQPFCKVSPSKKDQLLVKGYQSLKLHNISLFRQQTLREFQRDV